MVHTTLTGSTFATLRALTLSLSLFLSLPSLGFRSQEPETHREFLAAYIMHGGETRQKYRERRNARNELLCQGVTRPPLPALRSHTYTCIRLYTLGTRDRIGITIYR